MSFNTLLDPIINLLSFLLDIAYNITNNYGLAIIILSLLVNLILLPIYMVAEYFQKKELAIRAIMHDKLTEIKEYFSGQERFMMIQTLYKIHNYHPILALRSLLSLLIQIPFFFAAYQLLKHFEPFAGTVFWFISDLSSSDALIPFGRFSINILPIIMTVINIVAAHIYTSRTNPRTLISSINISLVFLLLLYTAPAALVLYWTCNNIFSLAKNYILSLSLKHSLPRTPFLHTIQTYLDTLLSNTKKIIMIVAALWGVAFYMLISFIGTSYDRKTGFVPNTLLGIAVCVLIVSGLVLALSFYRSHKHNKSFWNIARYILHAGSLLLGACVFVYYIFVPAENLGLLALHTGTFFFLIKLFACACVIAPNILWVGYYISIIRHNYPHNPHILKKQKLFSIQFIITVLASIATALLLGIMLPAQIYQSDPFEVALPFTSILSYSLPFILLLLCIPIIIYLVVPKKLKFWLHYIIVFCTTLLFSYTFIVPFNIGSMHHFILMFPQNIVPSTAVYIIEIIALIILIKVLYNLIKNNARLICAIMLVLNIIVVVNTIQFSIWYSQSDFNNFAQTDNTEAKNLPSELLAFSKEKQNIVMILLDMANGGDMQRALKESELIKNAYKDFTWYPNTLSISTHTEPSKPSMIAGWNYTPENIATVDGIHLGDKVSSAYDILFQTFIDHQYQAGITEIANYRGLANPCTELAKNNITCITEGNELVKKHWLESTSDYDSLKNERYTDFIQKRKRSLLYFSGLLRAAPITLKQAVYDRGNWNLDLIRRKESTCL